MTAISNILLIKFYKIYNFWKNAIYKIFILFRAYGGDHGHSDVPIPMQKVNIGKREIVGYGVNGEANYIDTVMAPFPAIRLG